MLEKIFYILFILIYILTGIKLEFAISSELILTLIFIIPLISFLVSLIFLKMKKNILKVIFLVISFLSLGIIYFFYIPLNEPKYEVPKCLSAYACECKNPGEKCKCKYCTDLREDMQCEKYEYIECYFNQDENY